MHAVIPLKSFEIGKARLGPDFGAATRSDIARATATHVAAACLDAGFDLTVVTDDAAVAAWAGDLTATVVEDPGNGLDEACAAGVASRSGPWVIVHGDLPLLDSATMTTVGSLLSHGTAVIAPSRDGGTNLLGNVAPPSLAYGPGSFHRHLGRLGGTPKVVVESASLIELDTPHDLKAAASLPNGTWLRRYLP